MLYSQQVKNLVSGISQQPDILRLPEQLDEQVNGFSTEAGGLQKRPPTVFVSTLPIPDSVLKKPLVHFVNRDEKERYFIIFTNDLLHPIRIFDIKGKEHAVNIKEDSAYVTGLNARALLRVITIADYTFILNRGVQVTMAASKSDGSFTAQGALCHVKQGQYGRGYRVWIDGRLVASYDTPDGSNASHTKLIDTAYIAQKLAESARANGCTVDVGNTWVRFHGAASIQTQDGFNNQALVGIKSTVQKFSLLPESAPDGYTVKVAGDPKGNGAGSYYVYYSAAEHIWKECARPEIPNALDPSTMPHILVREANGSFTFKRAEWDKRDVGDEDSNPLPSFVNHTLNDIFFYRNRLGFLSGENVILSESATYFNFWMTTANDILDTDCIDVPTTTSRVNILNYAVPFNQSLYCFSDSTQFMLSSDNVLSPKNCALIEVTGFASSPDCRPVNAGKNLYFTADRTTYTSVKEYYNVQDIADVKNAQDITSHVPNYIPKSVYQIVSSTNDHIMIFLTDGDTKSLFVYKYLFVNEQRIQASWSRFDMGDIVYGAFFLGSSLYLLLRRGGALSLERMDFTEHLEDFGGIEPYRVHLDCKITATATEYNSAYQTTTFNIGRIYQNDNMREYHCVLPNGKCVIVPKDKLIRTPGTRETCIVLEGDHRGDTIIVGIPYEFRARLSPIYIRQEDSKGNTRAITNGRLQVRSVDMQYSDTGGFVANVKSRGHTYTYTVTNRKIGTMVFGDKALVAGTLRIPVQSENTACSITIVSDFPYPLALIGFLWKGSFVPRTKGV